MAAIDALGFSMDDLMRAKEAGDIRTQTHPEFPELTIANYTEDVQYRNKWNNITLTCRGLILNTETKEIVARPWKKFFNIGQRDNEIDPTAPVEVSDKLDGSLGILYRQPDGKLAIATRGSFASDQAIHATNLLRTKYKDKGLSDRVARDWITRNTYLFEIIYPDNRIVVNYNGLDDLVILGAVDKTRGFYYGPHSAGAQIAWQGPVAETFKVDNFTAALSLADRKGMEGYVIRSGNKMVKLKQADYVELHRIVTNLNPKTIWEMLSVGKNIPDICADIPDEFHGYVQKIGEDLLFQHASIKFDAKVAFSLAKAEAWSKADGFGNVSRKHWAAAIQKHENKSLLFSILDNKPIDDQIWRMIKPRGDAKSLVEEV